MSLPSVLSPFPPSDPVRSWTHSVPHVIAHRGGAALSAENTLEAFQLAVDLGAPMLETDVQITADGVAVAFHDDTLDRVTNMRGPIRSYTLHELRQARVHGPYDQAGHIPTMAELLDAFPDVPWAIDLKHGDSIVPLAQAINHTNSASRVCVAHSWDSWLERVRELTSPRLERSLGWQSLAMLVAYAKTGIVPNPNAITGSWVHIGWRPAGISLMKSKKFADRLINMSHDLDMGVRVWTINKGKRMRRLFGQGVDGIFTDRPDLALDIIQEI